MKIQIKNLKPNPYRDIENYPYNQEKIQSLKDSISQTGFWDNILVRPKVGHSMIVHEDLLVLDTENVSNWETKEVLVGPRLKEKDIDNYNNAIYVANRSDCDYHAYKEPIVEIAYGHHRLEALKQVLKPEDYIDIPVKDLSDALMIKIMAKENDNDWGTNVIITDETVRVTRQFLEEHPEEVKNFSTGRAKIHSKEALKIATFLSWSEYKVYNSLERLGMIERGEIEKDVIESMPHDKAAKRFVSAVKKNPEITIKKQRTIANKLHKEESFGERSISDAFIGEKYMTPEKKIEIKSKEVRNFENFTGEIRNNADDLYEDLRKFVRLENEIGEYDKTVYRKLLCLSLNTLSKQINLIIKKEENEKTEFTNADPPSIGR